jgi:hypothetical protein
MLPPAAQDAFYKWSFDQDVRTANAMLWMLGVMALALIGLSVYVIGIS